MTAISPSEFYKANIGKEKEYVRIHVAHKIKTGEEIDLIWRRKATEDGYEFDYEFMTDNEFAIRTVPADGLELPLPKKDLSPEYLQKLIPVKRGDRFAVGCNGKALAPQDAFITAKGDGFEYIDGFELASSFNYAGQNPVMERAAAFIWRDQQPFKAILLDTATTFAFRQDERTASAGSLLILTPESEDGYKLHCPYPAGTSINGQIRVSAACTAKIRAAEQHEAAAAKQAKLKSRAPRIRLR
jgi:hypothetical protein